MPRVSQVAYERAQQRKYGAHTGGRGPRKRSISNYGTPDDDLGEYTGIYARIEKRVEFVRSHRKCHDPRGEFRPVHLMLMFVYLIAHGLPMNGTDFITLTRMQRDTLVRSLRKLERDFGIVILWNPDYTLFRRGHYVIEEWGAFSKASLAEFVVKEFGFTRIHPVLLQIEADVVAKGGITRHFDPDQPPPENFDAETHRRTS